VAAASAAAAVRPWIFLENYITPVSSYTHYVLLYNTLDVYYIHREAYNLQGIKLTPFRPGARDGPSPVTPSISPRPPADLQSFFVFCFSFVRSFSPSSFSHIDTHLKR
jgi:hypothetical protein